MTLKFAKPPVPGVEENINNKRTGIFPLRNGSELYHEGKRMHHCIASYADTIYENSNAYAYHVKTPVEEATVLIARHGKNWSIAEIRGVCNARISNQMREYVQKWLDSFNTTENEKSKRSEIKNT